MRHDEALTWAKKISEYFGKGKYSDEEILDITNFMRGLEDLDAQRIYTKLKELNRATYKIDVKALYDSSNELGIRRNVESRETNEYMAGKRIPCSMCGAEYVFNRYSPSTSASSGPVSACPVCGWNELQTINWRENGSPAADKPGLGANYAKWVSQFEAGLDERKRTVLRDRRRDEREFRDSLPVRSREVAETRFENRTLTK
jgi:hypothetical protein